MSAGKYGLRISRENESREIGRGEQVGRHIVGKCHHEPLVEFYSPCRNRLAFLGLGAGQDRARLISPGYCYE